MFASCKLSEFESEKLTFKILMFLLTVPIVVAGGMDVASGSFECLPAVDCPMPNNDTLLSNVCTTNSSQKETDRKGMIVITEIGMHVFLPVLILSFVMLSINSVWTSQNVFLKKQYNFENDLHVSDSDKNAFHRTQLKNNEESDEFRKVTYATKKAYVIPYTPEDAPHIDTSNRERLYKMDSRHKGVAVIINIWSIPGSKFPDRFGSDHDVFELNSLFEQIGFETVTHSNCTASEAKEILRRYTMDESYEKCDSIVVAILTHGTEQGLVFHDNEAVAVNELVAIVHDSAHYQGKPKLFFIQACRGVRITTAHQRYTGLRMPGHFEADTTDSVPLQHKREALPTALVPAREASVILESPISQGADVLLSFSTLPGHQSLRNTKTGGWFVNALVEVFSKHAWEEDILSLLTLVNYRVARLMSSTGWRQMPSQQSTLRKKLYLLPGYPKRENTPTHVNEQQNIYL